MNKFLMSFIALGLALFLGACSTVGGVGEDIKKVGEVITEEAEDLEAVIKKEDTSSSY